MNNLTETETIRALSLTRWKTSGKMLLGYQVKGVRVRSSNTVPSLLPATDNPVCEKGGWGVPSPLMVLAAALMLETVGVTVERCRGWDVVVVAGLEWIGGCARGCGGGAQGVEVAGFTVHHTERNAELSGIVGDHDECLKEEDGEVSHIINIPLGQSYKRKLWYATN